LRTALGALKYTVAIVMTYAAFAEQVLVSGSTLMIFFTRDT
jgi:hypothetical protein